MRHVDRPFLHIGQREGKRALARADGHDGDIVGTARRGIGPQDVEHQAFGGATRSADFKRRAVDRIRCRQLPALRVGDGTVVSLQLAFPHARSRAGHAKFQPDAHGF